MPKEQTERLLVRAGDFLLRQAVKGESRNSTSVEQFTISVRVKERTFDVDPINNESDVMLGVVPTNKSDAEIEVDKIRLEEELRHVIIKYSRRAKLYYVKDYGFKLVSGLIEYHKRHHLPIDDEGTIIKKPVKRAEWQLNHEQLIKTKKLGDGAFGDVYLGSLRIGLITKIDVAIKTINGTITTEENEKLFQEAMLMKRLVHPNVVQLVGVASNEEPVMIVMELAPGGSVLDAVQAVPGPSVYTRIKYCLGAANGLAYLAEMGIIHRDVAARNALIGKKEETKISDFGLSLVGGHKKEKKLKKVPVRYLAPETLASGQYSKMTDVWSFGIFMWEVFHNGKEPYSEISNARDVKKAVLSGYRMGNESDIFPFYLWTLTTECWKAKGVERPNFATMVTTIEEGLDNFHGKKQFSFKFWE